MPLRYSTSISVIPSDIDELKHVNNIRYLEWVQEISKAHWFEVVSEDIARQYVWVVTSHHIEYKASALLGDELMAETFVDNFHRHISTRVVEFKRQGSDQIIVRAITKWAMINAENGRPTAVPEEIASLF